MDLSNDDVIHVKKNEIEYLQFKRLLQYPEITHAFVIGLDKTFKIYVDPSEEELIKNELAKNSYKIICNELNLSYNNLVNTNQNHTDKISVVTKKINADQPDFNMYKNTDGLISNKKNVILSTINADCILIVFYDPIKKVIANVHSGWRGTLKRISVKTVEKMEKQYNCNPNDIICCMSPSIRKDHFEVDKDVCNLFYSEFTDIKNINDVIEKRNAKAYIDTISINKIILENIGLKFENIIDSGICSVCNKDLIHSYRAEGTKSGRSTLIIALK